MLMLMPNSWIANMDVEVANWTKPKLSIIVHSCDDCEKSNIHHRDRIEF